MDELKLRNIFMDNLKGILMFCVVLGHFCEKYEATHTNLKYLIFFIYLFHMPCFIYISGYFSKKYSFNKNAKLIYQYIVFGIFYTLIVNRFPCNNIELQIAYTIWTLWYLLALFYWRTIMHFITTKRHIIVIIISFIIAILIGCFRDIGDYFTLGRTIGFFPFFLLGYYSNENTIQKIKNIRKPIIFVFAIFVLLSTYIIVSTRVNSIKISMVF